jgi:hypothetical protein
VNTLRDDRDDRDEDDEDYDDDDYDDEYNDEYNVGHDGESSGDRHEPIKLTLARISPLKDPDPGFYVSRILQYL